MEPDVNVSSALTLRNMVPTLRDPQSVRERLLNTTFVGIDFGTSTTVASVASLGDANSPVETKPIPVRQPRADGRFYEHHLVPTAVAWADDQLLFGVGAKEIQNRLLPGVNIWTSFKMSLGVDQGPNYYNSKLPSGHPTATIVTARDAAAVFLGYLRKEIERFVNEEGLPQTIRYSVSVPASFEANQRRDLLAALSDAGIHTDGPAFIDEPNAAFLSYLSEANANSLGGYTVPRDVPLQVLVFDFGAGTCDISVLEIGVRNEVFYSKNLAISRFEALGGDDIDRALAYKVLLPQMLQESDLTQDDVSTAEVAKRIIPILMRVAERLKITLCKQVASQSLGGRLPDMAKSKRTVELPDTIKIDLPRGNRVLTLNNPSISYESFWDLMQPFIDDPGSIHAPPAPGLPTPISVLEPVESALRKAGVDGKHLDFVLLIGGSAENPYVQSTLTGHFDQTELEIPRDLRAHVSVGTAIHSLLFHGLRLQTIRPITSESIMAVTRNGNVRVLITAGTEIPCDPFDVADLVVATEGQDVVQIPISVSAASKILTVIEVVSRSPAGFAKGTPVTVRCELTADKLLSVSATVGGQESETVVLQPFSNHALAPKEHAVLVAEREVNISAAEGGGRPSVRSLRKLANALEDAGEFTRAAEMLDTIQLLDRTQDHATRICYLYDRAGRTALSDKWGEIAHERNPTATTAYNLALSRRKQGDIKSFISLMERALKEDPSDNSTRIIYGDYLRKNNDDRGEALVNAAFESLNNQFEANMISRSSLRWLQTAAEAIGRNDVVERIRKYRDTVHDNGSPFDEEKLLVEQLDFPVRTN